MIASVVFLVGFTRDTITDENPVQPGSKVPVPMKGIICMSQDNDYRLPVSGTPVVDATGKTYYRHFHDYRRLRQI